MSTAALKVLLSLLPSAAASAGLQHQGNAFQSSSSSIQGDHVETFVVEGTTVIQDSQYNMPETSGRADATAYGAKPIDRQSESDAIPEMVGKVLKNTGAESKVAAEGERKETVLRERQGGEKPHPKKRMWEVCRRIFGERTLLKNWTDLTSQGRVLTNSQTLHRSHKKTRLIHKEMSYEIAKPSRDRPFAFSVSPTATFEALLVHDVLERTVRRRIYSVEPCGSNKRFCRRSLSRRFDIWEASLTSVSILIFD